MIFELAIRETPELGSSIKAKVGRGFSLSSEDYPNGLIFQSKVELNMGKVSAAEACKQRMSEAKAKLPEGVGQMAVINKLVELRPEFDTLKNWSRWKNAYSLHVADPELTEAVEETVEALAAQQ